MQSVELFVNGRSASKKTATSDIHKFIWENIKLSPGKNVIKAVGTICAETLDDSCIIELKRP